jgi:integrase
MPTLRQRRDTGEYFVDFVRDGKRVREIIKIDGVPVRDRLVAEDWFNEFYNTATPTQDRPEDSTGDPRIRDLRQYFEEVYLKARGARPKTFAGYRKHLDEFVHYCDRHNIGRASQLNEERLQKWSVQLAEAKLSARTVGAHLSTVRAMLNAAHASRKLDAHPIRRWVMPRKDSKDKNTLTWQELRALAASLRKTAPPWLYRAVYWIMQTGQSPADVATLRWQQVDVAMGQVTRDRVKVRALRNFPLNSEAKALIEALKRERDAAKKSDPYVFHDWRGEPLNANRLYQHFTRWLMKHGHRYVTLKDLRHTYATLLANGDPERGVHPMPLPFLRILMNHTSITTTAIYAHAERADYQMESYAANLAQSGVRPAPTEHAKPLNKGAGHGTKGTKPRKR